MQIIPQPLPPDHLLRTQPRLPIRQRQKEIPTPDHNRHNHARGRPQRQDILLAHTTLDMETSSLFSLLVGGDGFNFAVNCVVHDGRVEIENEFEEGAGDEGGGEVRGEVVVEE